MAGLLFKLTHYRAEHVLDIRPALQGGHDAMHFDVP